MTEWRYNGKLSQWEWGDYDERRDTWTAHAWVTDEFIDRVADKRGAAVRLKRKIGTVPPPLQEHLPAEPPVKFF